jgi:hypothetical protein
MMILVLANDAWPEALILMVHDYLFFQLTKSSYEDYTEHLSVGLRRKIYPKPPKCCTW